MNNYFESDMERWNYLLSEINEVYHNANVKLGVSDGAMDVLYTIGTLGDRCPLSDVTRLCGSSRKTIHSAVKKLEKEGFLRLEAKNGREKLICLTEAGEVLMEKTARKMIAVENDILSEWEQEEREEYLRLLQKYLNDLKCRVNKI